jgi:hypothetical protein
MKIKQIVLLLCVLSFYTTLKAQRCYNQIIDASGLPMSTSELGVLEQTACELRDAFPAEFKAQFGVFDFSSYLHNESMKGQYEQVYNNALQKAKGEKSFYLFFARQTNQGGPNAGLRVALNIPKTGHFACLQDWERDALDAKLIRLFESSARSGAVAQGEIAAMKALKEVVDYLIGCCYVSNLRSVEECKSPLLDKYLENNFELYQIAFLGDQVIRLDNGNAVLKPHWYKEAVNVRKPVLYLHGTVIKADVDFSYGGTMEEFKNKTENIDATKKIRISAVVKANNGQGIFTSKIIPNEITITDAEKKMIGLRGAAFDVPLPNGINYFKEFKVEWYIHTPDKPSPTLLGITSNTMYVTTQAPKSNRLRETFFYLGCSNAIGKSTEPDVFAGVWQHFKDHNITNALGEPLIYYGSPLVENINANGLLVTKDGQCGSFVQLVIGTMNAMGFPVSNQSHILLKRIKNVLDPENEGFMVKDWTFRNDPPVRKEDIDYTHYNYLVDSIILFAVDAGRYIWRNVFDDTTGVGVISGDEVYVIDQAGIAAQNNQNPVSVFGNHQVLEYNQKYYDVSYGKIFSSISEWATQAVAGFYKLKKISRPNKQYWIGLFKLCVPGEIGKPQ